MSKPQMLKLLAKFKLRVSEVTPFLWTSLGKNVYFVDFKNKAGCELGSLYANMHTGKVLGIVYYPESGNEFALEWINGKQRKAYQAECLEKAEQHATQSVSFKKMRKLLRGAG